ncbi:MAG: hypothetical protein GAK28_01107 [Luteibacter sp.]|uniref:aspartyl protease family protein n=1 Tax=Luteibacter sp. TaxID=1886636 RepID=UPI0013800558|nr:aspartyl protease family protein [Luteibacter sp.]KAF1008680.1 MAG: hypothetical protein GAK28_01107 [Luteibacter sp.]
MPQSARHPRRRRFAALGASIMMAAVATAHAVSTQPASLVLQTSKETGQSIEARIDGVPGTFLFDSGWGVTAVTPDVAARIGCTPWGQITGFRAIGERLDMQKCNAARLQISGVTLPIPTLGVFDLMKLMPKGMAPLSGGIGLDVFDGRQITIQSRARRLVLETPASLAKRVQSAHAIPIRLVRDSGGVALTVHAGLPTSAGMVWMELDTGNRSGTYLVGKHVAALLGLKPDVAGPQAIHRDIVPGVTLAGKAVVSGLIMDGNIGSSFLDDWDLTLDLKAGKGWLAPAQP